VYSAVQFDKNYL